MNNIIVILKIDLGISSNAYDAYLTRLVESAREYIAAEGIHLKNSTGDDNLVEMYAAYLWRHRRENAEMPRSLRWALNNRLMSEKGRS